MNPRFHPGAIIALVTILLALTSLIWGSVSTLVVYSRILIVYMQSSVGVLF